jgi:hypothetical protein
MKKLWFGFVAIAAALVVLSCAGSPQAAEPEAAPGEYTQEQANTDFQQAYKTYRDRIILDGAKDYTVVSGDTLSRIAVRNYGSANEYGYFFPLLMIASDVDVPDPDLIEPGMVLTIPDLQKNLDSADARAAIKAYLLDIAAIYNKKDRAASALVADHLTSLSNSL